MTELERLPGAVIPGIRPAAGPVLQVRPADREQRIALAARQGTEVRVQVRNVGEGLLEGTVTAVEPWIEVPRGQFALEPGASGEVTFRVPPLVLEQGSHSFHGLLRSNSLLGAEEQIAVHMEVGAPVGLAVAYRGQPKPVGAWETTTLEVEVARTDGRPCTASVSASPWPYHWLPRFDREVRGGKTVFRFYAVAPGRAARRTAELKFEDAEPGVDQASFTLEVHRRAGPILVWDEAGNEREAREKEERDDPEWSTAELNLPDLLPGDRATGVLRVKNVGDEPASLFITTQARDAGQEWLAAGFGPAPNPGAIPTATLPPGKSVNVRIALQVPRPPDRRTAARQGANASFQLPAEQFIWRGGQVVIEAEGTPVTLKRTVNASVLAAIQPAATESRLTAAAIDVGLSLAMTLILYLAGWALLGDYSLAMLAQPLLEAVHGRSCSLAGGAALLLWWVLYLCLNVGCSLIYGTTPGKAYVGVVVRRRDGSPPGLGRAAARGFLQALLMPAIAWFAVLHPTHADFLDLWLDTRVVRFNSLWEDE